MSFASRTGPPYDTPVIARPKGTKRDTDSAATNAASFTEIISVTPEKDITFGLAKILVTWSGTDEQHIRVKLDTEIIAEYHATGYVMDWFPAGADLAGDGVKKVVIEAMATTTGATLTGFISGEES